MVAARESRGSGLRAAARSAVLQGAQSQWTDASAAAAPPTSVSVTGSRIKFKYTEAVQLWERW